MYFRTKFFSLFAFLWDFSLCQDRLSGDASELGTALLCSSRAGSVYVAVSRNSIVHRDWGKTIGSNPQKAPKKARL